MNYLYTMMDTLHARYRYVPPESVVFEGYSGNTVLVLCRNQNIMRDRMHHVAEYAKEYFDSTDISRQKLSFQSGGTIKFLLMHSDQDVYGYSHDTVFTVID